MRRPAKNPVGPSRTAGSASSRSGADRSTGMAWQERHPGQASAPWPLGWTTATTSRCRLAARFRLGGPPHGPQRAVEVQRPGLRCNAWKYPPVAGNAPGPWSTPRPARSTPVPVPWRGRPRPTAAWTRRGRAAASPPRPPPPARSVRRAQVEPQPRGQPHQLVRMQLQHLPFPAGSRRTGAGDAKQPDPWLRGVQPASASFTCFAGANPSLRDAAISIVSPVAGLRP